MQDITKFSFSNPVSAREQLSLRLAMKPAVLVAGLIFVCVGVSFLLNAQPVYKVLPSGEIFDTGETKLSLRDLIAGLTTLFIGLGLIASLEKAIIDYKTKTHETILYVLFYPIKKNASIDGYDTVTIMFDFQSFGSGDGGSGDGDGGWSSAVESYEVHLYKGKKNKYLLTEYGEYKTARKLAENIHEQLGYAIIDAISHAKIETLKKRSPFNFRRRSR